MSLARVDHAAALPALLPGYMRRPRWLAMAAAAARQIQEVEDAYQALLVANHISLATGAALDQLGAIVRQPRGGADDAPYRRRILAKIAANRSFGLVADILRLSRLVLDDDGVAVSLQNEGVASYILSLSGNAVGDDTAADLAAFLRKSTSAGVRGVAEYATVADADAFTLDGPAGLGFVTVPTLRFADLALPSGFDTVVGVRPEFLSADGSDSEFAFTFATYSAGATALSDAAPDIELTIKTGSETIDAVENVINTSAYLFVVSRSTVSGTVTAGDVFAASFFGDHSAGGVFATARE